MTHAQAFALVAEHAPQEAGRLWSTTNHEGCDTANAVADQYGEDEIEQAIADLKTLASGTTPDGWDEEIPSRTIEVCRNQEWLTNNGPQGLRDLDNDCADEWFGDVCRQLRDMFPRDEVVAAKGQRVLYHGWNGANTFNRKESGLGTFDVFTDDEWEAAVEIAEKVADQICEREAVATEEE